MLALGGMELSVDGRPVVLGETMAYKGMMLSGVPNLSVALGYTNASWTLKCELICEYTCRLLNEMTARGAQVATPTPGPDVRAERPFVDLTSGYVQRAIDLFPKQGSRPPWVALQNYVLDRRLLRSGPIDDDMAFAAAPSAAAAPPEPVAA